MATTALPHSSDLVRDHATRLADIARRETETIIATTVKMKLSSPTNQTPAFRRGSRSHSDRFSVRSICQFDHRCIHIKEWQEIKRMMVALIKIP